MKEGGAFTADLALAAILTVMLGPIGLALALILISKSKS